MVLPGESRNGAARSVLSNGFTSTLRYRITLAGPGEIIERDAAGGSVTVFVRPGVWTVTVRAWDSAGVLAGTGSETAAVVPGQPAFISVRMVVDAAYEASLADIYIHNENELRRIGTDFAIDGSIAFHLENDITLTRPWTPIGNGGDHFRAVFDGHGHSITINSFADLSASYLGLFGYTDGAAIKNLKIQCNLGTGVSPLNLAETGLVYIGALAGYAEGSEFNNITVSGSIGVTGLPYMACGGIAGQATTTTIQKSSFTGTLWGKSESSGGGAVAGGIVGSSYGNIAECYTSCKVTALGGAAAYAQAGGITGDGGGSITRCYAWAVVSASNSNNSLTVAAGGISGQGGSISQCYALGTVSAGGNGSHPYCYSGGIIGETVFSGEFVANCAALNTMVTSNDSDKVRRIKGNGADLSNNFAASDVVLSGNPTPALDPGTAGKDGETYARSAFKGPSAGAVYASGSLNWNFTPVTGDWKFLSGYDYPALPWQTSPLGDPLTF
ncbi:MAG: hypothetical protein LBK08_01315 [Treponema sp.]|nr:hypothetical protein [Treponema sp.]